MFGLAKFTSKCFEILCQNPTVSTTDCSMESICCNTEIPAVIVCPERDYRIFLNWSSIHLSIKTQPKARNVKRVSSAPEAFTMPNRTVRISLLKRLIFLKFHYSSCTLLLYHTVSDSFGIYYVETVKYVQFSDMLLNFHQALSNLSGFCNTCDI